MNVNLSRWVQSSIIQAIRPTITALMGIKFFAEAIDREKQEYFRNDSAILRITGPWYYAGAGQDRYKFEVMVLITTMPDDNRNVYRPIDRASEIANLFVEPIPVYQHPAPGTQIGCLTFARDARDPLRIVQFGLIDKDTEVVQSAVIVSLEICLDK